MGTPEIGAVCLQRLIDDGFEIVGVYTQPDRPKGRGMKTAFSPVKQTALAHGLPVFQPENFREPETVEALRALQPDAAAVVAYGRILPQRVLDIPPKGCINIHASILPQYRGAAPYQWAVLDGREETGVTAMYLTAEMDAGDIIEISRTPIHPDETAGQLLERLAQLGAALLSRTMARLAQGEVAASPQDPSGVSYAPMLDKTLCPIDWTKPARQIHNQVRGLNPWPVATATLAGTHFKIYSTAVDGGEAAPGTNVGMPRPGLRGACGRGAVGSLPVQADGGKRMAAPDYFRGHPLEG